jgi:hypothetical protein
VAGTDPGDRIPNPEPGPRRLPEAPSARYAGRPERAKPDGSASALRGPLARASIVALAGAISLVGVATVLTSTFGLLFVAGAAGGGIGLVLARAAAPRDDARPVSRRTVVRIAVVVALAAVVLADIATWLVALEEGGVLGPLDYLWTTFGPFVPAELVIAAVTAWWGASTGPVQG